MLTVNGTLTIEPGAEQALAGYLRIVVNGKVCCPESLVGALAGILSVNGTMTAYPDGAVLLKHTFVMDDTFALRAKNALYFAERRVVMLDPAIDPQALLDRGVRFKTKDALIAKGLAAAAVPLFDDTVNLRILPDGCAFVNDDATLGEPLLRRYGTKLYINGDLTIEKNGEPLEAVLRHIIESRYLRPRRRIYQTQNIYALLEKQARLENEVKAIAQGNKQKAHRKRKAAD